jgi:hypothetical protein
MKKRNTMALVVFLSFGLSSWAQAQLVSPVHSQGPQDAQIFVLDHSVPNGDQQLRLPFLSGLSGLLDRNGSNPGTNSGRPLIGLADSLIAQGLLPFLNENQQDWNNMFKELNTTVSYLLDANGSGSVNSTPLPAAAWLFGGGLISLICIRRKRVS